jgi:hypothetical protein
MQSLRHHQENYLRAIAFLERLANAIATSSSRKLLESERLFGEVSQCDCYVIINEAT